MSLLPERVIGPLGELLVLPVGFVSISTLLTVTASNVNVVGVVLPATVILTLFAGYVVASDFS